MGDFRSDDPYLRNRYGIAKGRLPKWVPLAISLSVIALAWTFWSGANHSNPETRYDLISFKPISDREIAIRFTINFKNIEKIHTCTLVARDYQANVAGEKIIDFPAGTKSEDVTTQIATRIPAVNAAVLGCQIR
jgi:Domain of unknown function (DUF4307)